MGPLLSRISKAQQNANLPNLGIHSMEGRVAALHCYTVHLPVPVRRIQTVAFWATCGHEADWLHDT